MKNLLKIFIPIVFVFGFLFFTNTASALTPMTVTVTADNYTVPAYSSVRISWVASQSTSSCTVSTSSSGGGEIIIPMSRVFIPFIQKLADSFKINTVSAAQGNGSGYQDFTISTNTTFTVTCILAGYSNGVGSATVSIGGGGGPGPLSGSITSSDRCYMEIGQSACYAGVSWQVYNATGTVELDKMGGPGVILEAWYGSSGSTVAQAISLASGGVNFRLYHSGVQLDSLTVHAYCIAGSSWSSDLNQCVSSSLYTVSTSAGAFGTISPSSAQVTPGYTTYFTVTPNSGYTASVSGCGGSLSGTTYTTGAVNANCTVTATFSPSISITLSLFPDSEKDLVAVGKGTPLSDTYLKTVISGLASGANCSLLKNESSIKIYTQNTTGEKLTVTVNDNTNNFRLVCDNASSPTVTVLGQSGSLSQSVNSCTILSGGNTCPTSLGWSTTNPKESNNTFTGGAPSNTTAAYGNYVTTTVSVPSGAITIGGTSGTVNVSMSNKVDGESNGTSVANTLSTIPITVTCTSGTSWNGSICTPNDSCGSGSTGVNGTPQNPEPTGASACSVGTLNSSSPADTSIAWKWSCGSVSSCTAPKYGCTITTDSNYNASGPNNNWGCSGICAAPLTQNVTVACDLNAYGYAATSGSVTRSQNKSAYSACAFPALPVTVSNSTYVSDNCSYPTPINGGWTAWSPAHNYSCGIGTQTQTRTCTNPTPAYGGNNCSALDGGNSSQTYTNPVCPPPTPTGFGAAPSSCGNNWLNLWWNASSGATNYKVYRSGILIYNSSGTAFSDGGLSLGGTYSYTITASNAGGTSSSASTSATVASNCPINCVGDWNTCSGGSQTYSISTPSAYGGTACLYANLATRSCGIAAYWSDWGICSGGTQSRTCTEASGGGAPTCATLPGASTQGCGIAASWSGYGSCSNGTKSGTCTEASGGGAPTCAGLGFVAGTNSTGCGTPGVCGSSNGGSFYVQPTSGYCNPGNNTTLSGTGPWTWYCNSTDGGVSSPQCSANKAVDGVCSGSHYACTAGTSASNSNNASNYTWSCDGINYGTAVSCQENKPAPTAWINAIPTGVAYNGRTTLSWGSTNATSCTAVSGPWSNSGTLSGSGLTNNLTSTTTFTFQCTGNGQTSALASVTVPVDPEPSICGSSNGGSFYDKPTSGLCDSGVNSTPSGTGPWTWTCTGANNATPSSCSANKAVNPVCSASHYSCSIGTSISNVENATTWSWSCVGINTSTTVSCSQAIPPPTITSSSCSSAGNTGTVSWALPTGYTLSYFRINDSTTGTRLYKWIPEDVTDTGASTSFATTPGHSYYVWVHTRLPSGSYSGATVDASFACNSAPTVTTTTATSIGQTSATSGGNVTSDGGSAVTARGVAWNTTGSPTTASSKTSNGTGTGIFSSSITGLTPGIKYYYRAYATNAVGTTYGNELSFTATDYYTCPSPWGGAAIAHNASVTASLASSVIYPASCSSETRLCTNGNLSGSYTKSSCIVTSVAPTVTTTTPITSITKTTAVGGGNTVSNGGSTVTEAGIVWHVTEPNTSLYTGKISTGWAIGGPWSMTMTGLIPGTLYHVRAYAINPVGTTYGSDITFTTLPYDSCNVAPWGVIAHTASVTAYLANPANVCSSETRTCTDGTLSRTYTYSSCIINQYTVTFNKNGGTVDASPTTKTQNYNTSVGTLPTPPTRSGYAFAGWNTAVNGSGSSFLSTTLVPANITVYAQWTLTDSCGPGSSGTPQLTEPTGASACSVGALTSSSPADTTTLGAQAWNWSCGVVSSCSAPKFGCRLSYDSNYYLAQYGVNGPNNNYGCAGSCYNGAADYPTCTAIPSIPTGLVATAGAVGSGIINVSWATSSGATSYNLSIDGTPTNMGAATSYQHTGLVAGSSHTYKILASNSGGSSPYSSVVTGVAPNASPTNPDLKVTAPYNTANSNGPVETYGSAPYTIDWNLVSNATSCTIDGSAVSTSGGSQSKSAIYLTQTHTLTCINSTGQSASDSVTITVPPGPTSFTKTCSADASQVVLNWTLPSGYTGGYVRPTAPFYVDLASGLTTTVAITPNQTYSGVYLHTRGSNGSWSGSVITLPSFSCVPPPTVTITVPTPASVQAYVPFTVSWTSTSATAVTASSFTPTGCTPTGGNPGAAEFTGSRSVMCTTTGSKTFSMTVKNVNNITASDSKSVNITAVPPIGVTLSANPVGPLVTLGATNLSWTMTGTPDSCDASGVEWSGTNIHNGDAVTQRSGMPAPHIPYVFGIVCHKQGTADANSSVTVVVNPRPSGTLTASPNPCKISAGEGSCNTNLTWNTSYPIGTSAITANGMTSVNQNSGSQVPFIVPYPSRTFYLYNDGEPPLQTLTVNAICTNTPVQTFWDGISKCVTPSGTLSSGGCFITAGNNSCNDARLDWTVTNPIGNSRVDASYGGPVVSSIAATSGTATFSLNYNSEKTLTLYSGNEQIKTLSVTALCATDTHWDGSNCIINAPGSTTVFEATPNPIFEGRSSTLTWNSPLATSCTGTSVPAGFSTGGLRQGTLVVSPTVTTIYTLTCSNSTPPAVSIPQTVKVITLIIKEQ